MREPVLLLYWHDQNITDDKEIKGMEQFSSKKAFLKFAILIACKLISDKFTNYYFTLAEFNVIDNMHISN